MNMRILRPTLVALLLSGNALVAQTKSILFTGRFPFVSFESINERANGSASRLDEYDFSYVTPGASAGARSLLPASAMNAYFGDANNDADFTKLAGFRTYFEALQIGGLFVKAADKSSVTAAKVWFTVRDNVATKDFELHTTGGTAVHVLRPGDWVRFTANGNLEFFMTADQLDVAAGPPNTGGISVKGAHALLQTAGGDLYYVPVQGGQWVNGNFGSLPIFAQDGAICKIDAAAITYDASGNIASFAPNSARLIIDELNGGTSPAPISIRQMLVNSGGMNRDGTPLVATGIYGKTCGIDIDPNGGTFVSTYADLGNNYTTEPNLVFCSDAGGYAGTIISTANSGSVAVINGVTCGSLTAGVPANGSWLGVNFDYTNFQPSLMSLVLIDPPQDPLLLDMPAMGALQPVATEPNWDIDARGTPLSIVFVLAAFAPSTAGAFVPSLPLGALPPVFTASSYHDVFIASNPATIGFTVLDVNGFGNLNFANPHNGMFTGLSLVLQSAGFDGTGFQLSNPVLMQLK